MKTLAELEIESTDGFNNPVISDIEFDKIRQQSRIKSNYEKLHTPIEEYAENDSEQVNQNENQISIN